MPVGRRKKKRRAPAIIDGLGAIFLKVADSLFAGTHFIAEAIKGKAPSEIPELLTKTESLLFSQLHQAQGAAEPRSSDSWLQSVLNKSCSSDELAAFQNLLLQAQELPSELLQIIPKITRLVRCIKVGLSEEKQVYLDGQWYTVWSSEKIPPDFSQALNYSLHSAMKYFHQNEPLVLFMAPGYDSPTKEFFEFLLSLNSELKRTYKLTFYGSSFEELKRATFSKTGKIPLVFGLWPWQFGHFQEVIETGEPKTWHFEPLSQDLFLVPIKVALTQPNLNKKIELCGCALKKNPQDKRRLMILSNIEPGNVQSENLAQLYLSRWPNLEEAFQDSSRKIERFARHADAARLFTLERLAADKKPAQDSPAIFSYYLQALDLFVRFHFFPPGYQDTDFATMKARFYGLKGSILRQKDLLLVTLQVPQEFPFLKDLQYALRRVNEKEVVLSGKRLWLATATVADKP